MGGLSTIFLLAIYALSLSPSVSGGDAKCESASTLERVDKCYTSIHVIGDRNFVRPKTLSSVNGHCKTMKNNLKCVKEYAKCLKPLPKTMYGILHAGMRKEVNARCHSEDSRKEFLRHILATEPTKATYDGIFFKLVNYYDFATRNQSADLQLPYICCGFQYILGEMFQSVEEGNSEDTAKYFDKSIKNMWGDIIDFACGKFGDLKSCRADIPETEQLYHKQNSTANFGILVPLIRFTKTLI